MNPESVLDTLKKVLGFDSEYEAFDMDIIMHANSVFSTLNQLGVGTPKTFAIQDNTALWSEFLGDNDDINDVKSYMYLRLRLIFDPPAVSSVLASYERMITEFEWRLNVKSDPPVVEVI